MTTKQQRRSRAIQGWKTRRRKAAERRLARAQTAALRLSIGDTLGWIDGAPSFVVVRLDHRIGAVTLNCMDGS